MRIPRQIKLLLLLLLITSISFTIFIDGTPAQDSQTDPPARAKITPIPSPDEAPVAIFRPTGPDPATQPTLRLVTAMENARTDFLQHLQELTASYHATGDQEQRRVIQGRICDLKRSIEIEIMTIQLNHARDLDLDEEADEIAASLALLAGPGESQQSPPEESGEGGGDHED